MYHYYEVLSSLYVNLTYMIEGICPNSTSTSNVSNFFRRDEDYKKEGRNEIVETFYDCYYYRLCVYHSGYTSLEKIHIMY